MTQHTPTPWLTNGRFIFTENTPPPLPAICEVFDLSKEINVESGKANAAFIVLACNEYDGLKKSNEQLVAALRELRNATSGIEGFTLSVAQDKADEILASCEVTA